MTSRDGRTQLAIEIPIETKNALKEADGTMWETVDEGVRMVLGLDQGSTEAAIESQLQDIRQERREIQEQLSNLESRLEDLDEREENLETKLADIREKKQSHKQRLFAILDEMEGDERDRPALAWSTNLKDAAVHEYGSKSTDNIARVVEDLRTLAAEENYQIAPHRLTRSPAANNTAKATDGSGEDAYKFLSSDDDE